MAVNAPSVQYRKEMVAAFDKTQSILRDTVTTEYMPSGGSAVFLVNDSTAAAASTRGLNGLIPSQPLSLTQNTATLVEWHAKPTVSGFNIFTAQSDLAKPLQANAMAAINRKIDSDIITILNTATNDTGAAAAGSFALITKALTILGNNKVALDGNITLLATPGLLAYLMATTQFTSADYVSARPIVDGGPAWGDNRMMYKWLGMNVIVDPTLPGVGTNAEKCFMYHKSAVGQAIDKNGLQFVVGYDEEDDYSFARCTAFTGSVLLQNAGVAVINHDGSAFAAS